MNAGFQPPRLDGATERRASKTSFLMGCFAALFLMLMAWTPPPAHAQNWSVYYNVKYGITDQETADFYLLNRGVNPVVVFIHGGGWQAGDKSAFAGYYAQLYANAGFHVVSINYRLASYADPTTQWNAQLQDAQEAIRFIREVAPIVRIDPNRIGAAGASVGGQLAVFLGSLNVCARDIAGGVDRCLLFSARSSKVNAVLDMFGPVDLTKPEMYNNLTGLAVFGGRSYAEAADLYRDASPIFSVNAASAPTCIVQGLADTLVPPSQSYELRDALAANNVQLITYNGGHEFAGLNLFQRVQVDTRALQCMSGLLHPNPLNAR